MRRLPLLENININESKFDKEIDFLIGNIGKSFKEDVYIYNRLLDISLSSSIEDAELSKVEAVEAKLSGSIGAKIKSYIDKVLKDNNLKINFVFVPNRKDAFMPKGTFSGGTEKDAKEFKDYKLYAQKMREFIKNNKELSGFVTVGAGSTSTAGLDYTQAIDNASKMKEVKSNLMKKFSK